MYGAILGDMIGAPYEFDRSPKIKDFPLFSAGTEFTDDSVMTIAVAEALLNTAGKTDDEIRSALISSMRKWGRRYPGAGYGGRFSGWLIAKIQSLTAATGTARPCGYHPLAGCTTQWMRRDGSPD